MLEICHSDIGSISKKQFLVWYASSEAGLSKEVKTAFDALDKNGDGNILCHSLPEVFAQLKNRVNAAKFQSILKELGKSESDHLSFEDFEAWYKHSVLWQNLKHRVAGKPPRL